VLLLIKFTLKKKLIDVSFFFHYYDFFLKNPNIFQIDTPGKANTNENEAVLVRGVQRASQ